VGRYLTPRRVANIALNHLEAKLRVPTPRSLPRSLDIVLTKACNLNCTFCISSTLENARWLEFEVYERIAAELFPTASRLSICSGGEPLLYPRIRDVLRIASDYGVKTLMVSNGMLLKEDVREWLVADQTLGIYYVSLDGSTKEVLERIRRGARFETIVENVTEFSRLRNAARKRLPRLGIRFSVMRSNAEDLVGISALAGQMGVEEVLVSYVNFANDMSPQDSLYYDQDYAADVFARARAAAAQHGVKMVLPPLPREDKENQRCDFPWEFAQIEADGSVRHCYMAWVQTVGNFVDGFADIWRGEAYGKIRSTMEGDDPYFPYCKVCAWRKGCNNEAAHNHRLHMDAFKFKDPEAVVPLAFNRRSEENRTAFKLSPSRRRD